MLADHHLRTMATTTFRFVVAIDGAPVGAFTECTLPTIEWDVEEVREGGLNTYVHQLPGGRKKTTLTLKNGVGYAVDIMAWYSRAMQERFRRRRVTITLLNSFFMPVMIWHIEDACPVRWTGPELRANEDTVAIHTLEIACGEIVVVR